MHLYLESSRKTQSDCSISALSWMGKVPDDIPEEEGWKLNRVLYYQEGWLATGNARGIVGATYTSSHSKRNGEMPPRTNYNLRGHRTEVTLVKWNEPYQKLATCDSSGIIFVWIKYEGRWSIELINDRNTPVTHFCWSHDGRMALICYQDGFVLVGSVAGQRYWSTMLILQSTITSGVFTPDDQQVYFGTSSGLLVVMDVHGATISQETIMDDTGISALSWSCPKFKMEEGDDTNSKNGGSDGSSSLLAVLFDTGLVYLIRGHDDVIPIVISTGLKAAHTDWTNSGELLAVAGHDCPEEEFCQHPPSAVMNVVKFYTRHGTIRYSHQLPYAQHPISALTWGHNDKRIFIAAGPHLYIGRVTRKVASLQLICRLAIRKCLTDENRVARLPLPKRLRSLLNSLYSQTIRCCVPDSLQLREFVSRPPCNNRRLHCTMIRHDEDLVPTPGACYTLYLEYLGGLVPLLKGKRTSKIRPEFVIYDPQADEVVQKEPQKRLCGSGTNNIGLVGNSIPFSGHLVTDSSDSEYEDICASPRLQRRRKLKKKLKERLENEQDELIYLDTLPEQHRLVEVTSNIWGTKFKLHGVATSLTSNLGEVTYKTSLLHLQPRQMTVVLTELRDDIPPRQDPNFNPNVFSEDEEEPCEKVPRTLELRAENPPIAPMTPKRTPSCYSNQDLASPVPGPWDYPKFPCSEVPSKLQVDEHPYVNFGNSEMVRLRAELKDIREGSAKTKTCLLGSSRNCSNDSSPLHNPHNHHHHHNHHNIIESPLQNNYHNSNHRAPSSGTPANRSPSHYSSLFFSNSRVSSESANSGSRMSNPNSSPSHQTYYNKNKLANASIDSMTYVNHYNIKTYQEASSSNCQKIEINQSSPLKGDIIKYIDDESGDSDGRSYTPSPSRTRPLGRCHRARSKSVGQLINLDSIPPTHLPPPTAHHFHQLSSLEAFLAFSRSLSLKDCKKRQVVAEVERPTLIDFGKSHSLDSSLLILNCKNLLLTGTSLPPSSQLDHNYINNLHSSPSRIHVIKDPMHFNHIYENINVYTTSYATSLGKRSPLHSKECTPVMSPKMTTPLMSPRKFPKLLNAVSSNKKIQFQHSQDTICVNTGMCTTSSLLRTGETIQPPLTPRTLEKRFFRGLKESALGERLASLQREYLGSSARPSPPPTPKHVASPEVSRRNKNLAHLAIPSISPTHSSRSTPPTPSKSRKSRRNLSTSPIRKHLLNSPLLCQRKQRKGTIESSDEEVVQCSSDAEIICSSSNYRDLETFQKNQLRNKLRRTKGKEWLGQGSNNHGSESKPQNTPRHRQLVMHNKAPLWNENSQVYQLDFGGRVTQESAKNFQIEFKGKQVMQFGRIDGNAYTLDFQYPFSAIQAFSVALANVTQRLK